MCTRYFIQRCGVWPENHGHAPLSWRAVPGKHAELQGARGNLTLACCAVAHVRDGRAGVIRTFDVSGITSPRSYTSMDVRVAQTSSFETTPVTHVIVHAPPKCKTSRDTPHNRTYAAYGILTIYIHRNHYVTSDFNDMRPSLKALFLLGVVMFVLVGGMLATFFGFIVLLSGSGIKQSQSTSRMLTRTFSKSTSRYG